jgi:hypothetical protein
LPNLIEGAKNEAAKELAELKSKLESGKLVEFKYAVGDEVFFLSYSDDNLDEEFCCGDHPYTDTDIPDFDNDYCEDKSKLIVRKASVYCRERWNESYTSGGSSEFNCYTVRLEYKGDCDLSQLETNVLEDKLYATKEEAKAKLKEIQGELK